MIFVRLLATVAMAIASFPVALAIGGFGAAILLICALVFIWYGNIPGKSNKNGSAPE